MQNRRGVRRIAAKPASHLPMLKPPAGYVILIQDVEYGSRYKIARLQQLDRHQIEYGAEFPFETKVVLILQAEDAAGLALDLHDEHAGDTEVGEWFDLHDAQAASLLGIGRPPPPSLSDLAFNEIAGESLLQDSKVVATKPQVPRARVQRTQKRRAPKIVAWAMLILIVVAGVFMAQNPREIRTAIETLTDQLSQLSSPGRAAVPIAIPTRSASPTPIAGKGEVFYVNTRAWARTCPRVTCNIREVLKPGTLITAIQFVTGSWYDDSDKWIKFSRYGQVFYVHSSLLSSERPTNEAPAQQSSTTQPLPTTRPSAVPTSTKATIQGKDEVYYVKTQAQARTCARWDCDALEMLQPGMRITSMRYVTGQPANGNDRWIRFLNEGRVRYIHSDLLSVDKPVIEPTSEPSPAATHLPTETDAPTETAPPPTDPALPTVESAATITQMPAATATFRATVTQSSTPQPPPPTATEAEADIYFVETANNLRARVRSCPGTDCSILGHQNPGDEVPIVDLVPGQNIGGNDQWYTIEFEGETGYIHSELLSLKN